jgi:hypothetical protein
MRRRWTGTSCHAGRQAGDPAAAKQKTGQAQNERQALQVPLLQNLQNVRRTPWLGSARRQRQQQQSRQQQQRRR